jgi:hypothetical protein
MLVLDENLPAGQRLLLRKWRVHFRVIGVDIAYSGTTDENLIPVLHHLSKPTFLTLDRNFYRLDWAHSNYGLVWLDVRRRVAAEFTRRFLKHDNFDTQAKRLGIVARVGSDGVGYWRLGKRGTQFVRWADA